MGAKDHLVSVKDAVHKLQLSLLDGILNEDQLFAAGSLMSRGDYDDIVTERTIANLCGYPLCTNSLPSERPRKGRYRISLKEHKVYDLHETYMYCSSSCVVSSRAFAASLQEERCAAASTAKIDEILSLFGDLSLKSEEGLRENLDLGISKLKIQEKAEAKVGEVSVQDWIGPSNAIEGYVPQIDRTSKPSRSKAHKNGSKTSVKKDGDSFINEMDFMSTIITEDEYNISKTPGPMKVVPKTNLNELKGIAHEKDLEAQFEILETASVPLEKRSDAKPREFIVEKTRTAGKEELSIPKVSSRSCERMEAKEEAHGKTAYKTTKSMPKSSLKSTGVKKPARSVSWADAKADSVDNRNLCEVQEIEGTEEGAEGLNRTDPVDDDNSSRYASAEACAMALSYAAEAVASGESDATDAVLEAGIVISPHPRKVEGEHLGETDFYEPETAPPKWPRKPGMLNTDFFDSEDSWYDTPPDGFSLTLSTFATMWNALFVWLTSSSLAYIYGWDESTHEDFLLVNGREYPRKIVLPDGRSSEIKQTLSGCLARALPGLVSDLRLPTPLSSLEQGLGHLLDTMSFMDALPSFRMKQWQVLGLLFIEALSVCRLPPLASHMTSRRLILHKVLDGAQISVEEYEAMKDVVIPLGRVPHFSSQSGG